MTQVHSKYGGSNAARYLNCYGSTAQIAALPKLPDTSKDASTGTWAHKIAAYCLTPSEYHPGYIRTCPTSVSLPLGVCDSGRIIDRETARCVQVYLDYVFEILDANPDAVLFVEHRFNLAIDGVAEGEVGGTVDVAIYLPRPKKLINIDYKHGVGIQVLADDNSQGKFYATGALFTLEHPVAEIEVVIVQPRDWRNDHGAEEVRPWTFSVDDAMEFQEKVTDAVTLNEAMLNGLTDIELLAGPWCGHCPAFATCSNAEKEAWKGTGLDLVTVDDLGPAILPDPASIDSARLASILRAAPLLETWLKRVYDFALASAMSGVEVSGFQVEDKQARAKWIDDGEEVAARLALLYDIPQDEIVVPKLVGITDAEKVIKQHIPSGKARTAAIEDMRLKFTMKDSSGFKLVPAVNPGKAVNVPALAVSGLNVEGVAS